MKLNDQPIANQLKANQISKAFTVLRQDRNKVTLVPKETNSVRLSLGNIISFNQGVVGIVVEVNKDNTVYTALLSLDHPVKEGTKVQLA
jgi:uncharacterized protein YkvS